MQSFRFIVLTAPQVILCISQVEADCQCLPCFLFLWGRAVPWGLPTPLSSCSLLCPGTGTSADSCPLPGLKDRMEVGEKVPPARLLQIKPGPPPTGGRQHLGCGDTWSHSHSLLWRVPGLHFLLQTNPFCFSSFRDSSTVPGPQMAPSPVFRHRHETRGWRQRLGRLQLRLQLEGPQ